MAQVPGSDRLAGGAEMVGFRIGERERAEIVELYAELGSVGAVANSTGRHRNTVRRILAAPAPQGPARPPAPRDIGDGWGDRAPLQTTLGAMEQRLLQAMLRSAQLHVCRDPACRQEFATFAMETKSGKRLRAFCPACGRGSIVRIQPRGQGRGRGAASRTATDDAATNDPGDA